MSDDVSRSTIERVANRYGLTVRDEDLESHRSAIRNMERIAGAFVADPPTTAEPADVRPGDDPYNAFRKQFELPPVPRAETPLAGLDVAVKENTVVAGVETTCGSPGFTYAAPYSATVVERLREAGATIVGTTNMDEFAYYTTGETCAHGPIENPTVEDGVPGGSSSGSAAAVAAGLVDAALGTDTGGSVRIPASFCGVVGFKPTHRLLSRFGVIDLAPSLDHVGPLAPDVETAATVAESIAGPDVADPSTHSTATAPSLSLVGADTSDALAGLSVGLVEESLSSATPAVEDGVEDAVEALASAGAAVDRVSLPGYDLVGPAVGTIIGAEFAAFVDDAGRQYGSGTGTTCPLRKALASATDDADLGDHVREQLLYHGVLEERLEGRHYVDAMDFRRRFTATVREQFREVDVLVTPTTPMTAPDFGDIVGQGGLLRTMTNTAPFNLTGSPAVSVPCEAANEPVGVQLVADWHDDRTALRAARAVETAVGGR